MSSALAQSQQDIPQSQEREPKRNPKYEELTIPPQGTSLVTGLPGAPVWGAINKSTLSSRGAIGESDCDDLINYIPMSGLLQQLPSNGTTIATLAASIIWQTELFLNNVAYIYSMCSNGHLYQTNLSGATTDIWQTAQFSENGTLNATINVTSINTTNLSVGMSVTGTDIPANTTIASIVTPGVSGAITISNAATGSGTFSLTFSTPLFTTVGIVDIAQWQSSQIIISDSAAQKIYNWNGTQLFIAINSQPVQYIGVFQNRLWGGFTMTLWWTQGGTFNSLAGDSGSYLITDNACLNPVNCIMDSPYGLFVSGANWFKFFTSLTDVGVPAVLTFQQNTIESQIGPLSKWAVIVIGNVIFFANNAGVWAVNGGQPSQISQPFLNGFFQNLSYPQSSLSMAYGMVNSVPCLFVQAYYNGDTQVPAGYTVFGYGLQSTQWFRYVQGTIAWISGIVSSSVSSNNPVVIGCDGTKIFQLFASTANAQNAQYNSKMWDLGSALDIDNILNVAVEYFVSAASTITVSQLDETNTVRLSRSQSVNPGLIQIVNNSGQNIYIHNNSLASITIAGLATITYQLFQGDGCGRVRRFALNVVINGTNSSLISLVVSYHRTETGRGS